MELEQVKTEWCWFSQCQLKYQGSSSSSVSALKLYLPGFGNDGVHSIAPCAAVTLFIVQHLSPSLSKFLFIFPSQPTVDSRRCARTCTSPTVSGRWPRDQHPGARRSIVRRLDSARRMSRLVTVCATGLRPTAGGEWIYIPLISKCSCLNGSWRALV